MRFVTHTHTRTQEATAHVYKMLYGDATAAITLGIPLERDGAKKKKSVLLYVVAFGLLH